MILFGRRPGADVFVRGEINQDGRVDLSDAIGILQYLFLGANAPACLDAADVNDTGTIDLSDAVYLLGHLYLGTPAPPAPYPEAAGDPTSDEIRC